MDRRTFIIAAGAASLTPAFAQAMGKALDRPARLVTIPAAVLRLMGRLSGRQAQIERLSGSLQVEIGHTTEVLGWTPRTSLQQALQSLVRFARWQDILASPQPPGDLPYSKAIWHYARAIALARTGELEAAATEIEAMQPLMENDSIWYLDGNDYPASQILAIADKLARGELALAKKDYEAAIAAFTAAVIVQDTLPYTEPPFWYYPTRQSLGHALLQAGDPAAAEAVYRKDLKDYPRNGWSLFGLALALEGQGKEDEAEAVRQRFANIWGRADVELSSSVL